MKPYIRKADSDIEQNDGTVHVQKTGLRISSTDRIRQIIRFELAQQMADQGHETFDEADDFEFDEDDDKWESPYELQFEPEAQPDPAPAPGAGQSPAVTASGDSNEQTQTPPAG